MITLTYETIEGRQTKIRGVISSDDKGYSFVLWVGETFADDVSAVNRMKRLARKALKEAQNEAA